MWQRYNKVFNGKSIVAKLCLNFMFDARFFHHLEAGLSRSPVEAPITFAQSRACILDSISPGKMKKKLPPHLPKMKTRQDKMKTTRKKVTSSPPHQPSLRALSLKPADSRSILISVASLVDIPKHPKHHCLLHQHGL